MIVELTKRESEADTDQMTLVMPDGTQVYAPRNLTEAYWTVFPYLPDWGTPWRMILGFLSAVAFGIPVILALGITVWSGLAVGVYIGPVWGIFVLVTFGYTFWQLGAKVLEKMRREDDDTIARFKQTYDS